MFGGCILHYEMAMKRWRQVQEGCELKVMCLNVKLTRGRV